MRDHSRKIKAPADIYSDNAYALQMADVLRREPDKKAFGTQKKSTSDAAA